MTFNAASRASNLYILFCIKKYVSLLLEHRKCNLFKLIDTLQNGWILMSTQRQRNLLKNYVGFLFRILFTRARIRITGRFEVNWWSWLILKPKINTQSKRGRTWKSGRCKTSFVQQLIKRKYTFWLVLTNDTSIMWGFLNRTLFERNAIGNCPSVRLLTAYCPFTLPSVQVTEPRFYMLYQKCLFTPKCVIWLLYNKMGLSNNNIFVYVK